MARKKSSGVTPGRMTPASSLARSSVPAASATGAGPGLSGLPGALVTSRIASARPALAMANRASRSIHSRSAVPGARVRSSSVAASATCCIS